MHSWWPSRRKSNGSLSSLSRPLRKAVILMVPLALKFLPRSRARPSRNFVSIFLHSAATAAAESNEAHTSQLTAQLVAAQAELEQNQRYVR